MHTGAPQSMDAYVEDLEAVRQKLGLTKFAMLGDSFGGFIAMAYASAHPEHVAKLVLSDSPGPKLHQSFQSASPDAFEVEIHSTSVSAVMP